MMAAFWTPQNRIKTLVLLLICALLAAAAAAVGINDNPPGILLAYLAAVAFVLAFVHPWRTVRQFGHLLGAAVLGVVLFIILNIASDSIAQNPTASRALLDLMQSPAYDALNLALAMLIPAAFIVGAVGSVVMVVRSRRRPS